jgi:hypothetical protein
MSREIETSYHESSHAVSNYACGLTPVRHATINPEPDSAGHVMLSEIDDRCARLYEFSAYDLHEIRKSPLPRPINSKPVSPRVAVVFYAKIIVLVSGAVGVRLFVDPSCPPRNESDMVKAMFYACNITARPSSLLDCAKADAERILQTHKHLVVALADALTKHRFLNSDQIEVVLTGAPDALRRRQMAASVASAELFSRSFGNVKCLSSANDTAA